MKKAVQEETQTHYDAIKRHGYELTKPLSFVIPTASSHTSIIKTIFKLFIDDSRQKSIFNPLAPKNCTILPEKLAILTHSNKLTAIFYTIADEKLVAQSKACFLLNDQIKRVLCPYNDSRAEKSESSDFFVVEYESSPTISLFKVEQRDSVILSHEIKESSKIIAMRFICNDEILLLLKDRRVVQYKIKDNKLKKTKFNMKIVTDEDQSLVNGDICDAWIDKQLKICIFYLLFSKKHQKYQLNIKECSKNADNNLQEHGTFYDIFQNSAVESLSQRLCIYSFGQALFIHQNLTIFVIQKKFGKYIRSDVISQLFNAKKVMVIEKNGHMFICSMGETEIEFWEVKMKDVGCNLQLLDVVEIEGNVLASKTIKAWIFLHSKKPQFVLLADEGPRNVGFYLTKKMDKLFKLTKRVHKEENKSEEGSMSFGKKQEFATKLKQIEELGSRLGFNRRQFYLKLWHQSQKNSAHIIQFLLPCKDFKVIFNEITLFLRVKKLAVTETIKILKKIEKSILQEMTERLDLELVRQFLKTNFQRRKLKLYSGDILMDFQQYQKVYESSVFDLIQKSIDLHLFPQKFKHDIVWKEQVIQKPIYIPYILRQFRLLILEDYPKFLLTLLKPYNYHLQKVIETFPYLLPQFPLKISIIREELVMLSNIYQQEKIEEQQYSWLGYIRENEWERQNSSVDFIFNHLFSHHATSLINDKLRQFHQGVWCSRNKYMRHTLIETRKKQFQEKLPAISDGSSLLFLCEKANQVALEENRLSQGEGIVQIMHKHNHLPLVQYYRYRLYCALHFILVKERLIHSDTTIFSLMQMAKQKLVACFFLGDRQRIDLLFKVVAKQYPSKSSFNEIIEAFIMSQECSKVQLEMLTNYLIQQGETYQQNNQELINIVISGFLKRIQIRENDKSGDFLIFFRNITLAENLLIKMAIFEAIKTQCASILKTFELSFFTYETVIHQPVQIINTITHKFFSNNNIRHKSIYIQGRQVNLSFPQNLFVVILYLKDKIYSFNEQMQIYLIFCEAILSWNQFQLLKLCFNQEIIIDEKEYYPEQFYSIVVDYMLGKYYEDETLLYTDETKEHILNLLSLIDSSSQIFVVETAKIEFVGYLEPLKQSISVQYMQIIKEQWQKQEERNELFHDIIDLFQSNINFKVIMNLYESLQKIRLGVTHVIVKTQEFIDFSLYICRKHVKNGRFSELCDIISFLNSGENDFKAKYSIMTECFLQVLDDRVQSPHHIRQSYVKVNKLEQLNNCKELIDYYLLNYHSLEKINNFFSAQFDKIDIDDMDNQIIQVDQQLCFTQFSHSVSRQEVWDMIVKKVVSMSQAYTKASVTPPPKIGTPRQQNISNNALDSKSILFTYYFICKVLHDVKYFFQLEEISFNHLDNISILEQLYKDQVFRFVINFKKIYLEYLKGLFKVYYIETEDYGNKNKKEEDIPVLEKDEVCLEEKLREIKEMTDNKLIMLISDLPLDKGTFEGLRAMKKLIALYQNAFVHPDERSQKMKTVVEHDEHSLPLYFDDKPQQRQLKESVTQMAITHQDQRLQVKTFRFLEFQQIKKQIANKSNIVSEKVMIEKVLDELENNQSRSYLSSEIFQEKFNIKRALEAEENLQIGNVLEDLTIDRVNQQIYNDYQEMQNIDLDITKFQQIKSLIQNKEFQKVTSQFPPRIIMKAIEQEYYRPDAPPPTRPKKRILRSNTLKESILNSRLITLLQILDGLKLYGSTSKLRILRSCLMAVSSEELLSIEGYLLFILRLNILLFTKNIQQTTTLIFNNIRNNRLSLDLPHFKIAVLIIDSFIRKCREEISLPQSFKDNSKNSDRFITALLYFEFISSMIQTTRPAEEKLADLQQIMQLLNKEELLSIHQKILGLLEDSELYVSYLQLIHSVYASHA